MFGEFFDFGEQKFHRKLIEEIFSIIKVLHRKFFDRKILHRNFFDNNSFILCTILYMLYMYHTFTFKKSLQ